MSPLKFSDYRLENALWIQQQYDERPVSEELQTVEHFIINRYLSYVQDICGIEVNVKILHELSELENSVHPFKWNHSKNPDYDKKKHKEMNNIIDSMFVEITG